MDERTEGRREFDGVVDNVVEALCDHKQLMSYLHRTACLRSGIPVETAQHDILETAYWGHYGAVFGIVMARVSNRVLTVMETSDLYERS